jgi:hypothetical protein
MKYINTLPQSRSFNRPWLTLHTSAGVAAGAITSIQITTASDAPIYLAGLDIENGVLSLSLRQNDLPFASLITDQSNEILRMTAEHENCISAIVRTGALDGVTASYRDPDAQIRRCFIYVHPDANTTPRTYEVMIDGVLHRYTDTVELSIDAAALSYQRNELGTVTISMSADQRNQFNRVSTDAEEIDDTLITSINGIMPNEKGEISLRLSYGTYGTVPLTRVSNRVAVIQADLVSAIPPCDSEDYIDTVLSPGNVRDFSKMPLDDAYTSRTVDGKTEYTRNYLLLENRKYALYYANGTGVTLYERNPLHDSE